MSTKNSPGAFDCYRAALPDEPIFTILARDPAAPTTLRFWADARLLAGKHQTPDDMDRINDARRTAGRMMRWREENENPFGNGPTWRGAMAQDEIGHPVCAKPDNTVYIYAERDGDEAVRLSIEWLKQQTQELMEGQISRELFGELIEHACRAPDRPRERVVPVEEAAYDAASRDARTIGMMQAIQNAIGMIDDLATTEVRKTLFEPVRRILFKGLEGAPLIGPAKEKQADEITAGLLGTEATAALKDSYEKLSEQFVDTPRHVGKHPALGVGYQTPGEEVVVDSQPDDLAHAPEVPPHRFSVFHKGEMYAYARGLEINPIHLPTALDAMAKDGWHLLAIFGQADSQHVGFIFRRAHQGGFTRYPGLSANEIPAVLMPGAEMIHPRQGGIASPKSDRFLAGEPLDEIRKDDPPVAEPARETFVIEYAVREPDGSCTLHRTPFDQWPGWAHPCSEYGRGLEP